MMIEGQEGYVRSNRQLVLPVSLFGPWGEELVAARVRQCGYIEWIFNHDRYSASLVA